MNRLTRAAGAVVAAAAVSMTARIAARDGDALSSLVAAERAFARMSVETSQRDAFLAHFADEGVWFAPGPVNTKEALAKQPPPAGPARRVLDWDPVTGDVSASGDLGYTTGPWVSSERGSGAIAPKVLGTGWFFSVWRWTRDAGWKVLADFGIDVPHALTLRQQPFERATVRGSAGPGKGGSKVSADELRAADTDLGRRVSEAGWTEALAALAIDDVRVYRGGHQPGVGRQAASALLSSGPRAFGWQPSFALSSSAGDLGVTYGAYTGGAEPGAVRGYYLHVWKRAGGKWKLAADVANDDRQARQ